MDLNEMVTYTGKENINDENLNLNVNVDTNDKYYNNLSVNLHKTNMRRTINLEDTKQTQNSIIDAIDGQNDEYKEETKRLLFPNNKNIYTEKKDENIVQNLEDKVPLI